MKELIFCLSIVILHLILSQVMPWWNLALVAFAVGLIIRIGYLRSFWLAFISIFLLWAGMSAFTDLQNQCLLGSKLAQMLNVSSPLIVYSISGVLGALVSAFSAASGYSLSKLIFPVENDQMNAEDAMNTDDLKDLRPEWKDKSHP